MNRNLKIAGLCLVLLARAYAAEPAADVWIIAGQSNASGYAELPGPAPDPRVKMWDGKTFVEAQDPIVNMHGNVGPWMYAALEVAKAGVPVKLTGWSMGAQSIEYWDEKNDGSGRGAGWLAGNGTGLSAVIKQSGQNAGVFLWYQGETDGMNGMSENDYKEKLKDLAKRVREKAKSPQMMFVVVQVGLWKEAKGDFMPIREAERRFVIEDGNALLVTALGRTSSDKVVHLDKPGYKELGEEIARALLKNRYGKKDVNWPGPVMDAAVAGTDGKTVGVHFAEVKKLSGLKKDDFGALDSGGEVKCVKADATNTLAILTFERALKPPAKVVYGFGKQSPDATLVDEAGNRAPAVQLEIKAGSLPADKETSAPNGAGVNETEARKK
jgi:hypothetical protein